MTAKNLFQELGDSVEEVALTLSQRGIRGVRNAVRDLNPVCRYLRSEMPDASLVDVIRSDRAHIRYRDGREREIPLPHAVSRFLDAFNDGKFPDLEMR